MGRQMRPGHLLTPLPLSFRKGIEHLPPDVPTYLRAVAPAPAEPRRLLCSVCGYWGKYKCKRCAMPYCDLNCEGVHNGTRCERRVI